MKKLFINLINFYQIFLSFVFVGACKYSVSCSEYAKQSIGDFGVVRGSLMGMKRIWSCR